MDTNETNGPEESVRRSRRNSGIVAAGVAFGLTLAGLGVAAAQTESGTDTTTTAPPAEDGSGSTTSALVDQGGTTTPDAGTEARPPRPAKAQETELTGEVADKVRAAAQAAVPDGTVLRVETDSDGSPYEAHVRKADGTEVVVKVNESFEVTATEETHFGGHHGPGRHGPGAGETALTGETAEKVTAAAQAAVPGGDVLRVETGSDGSPYEAHVRTADGAHVEIKVDEAFNVTSVEEHAPDMRHPWPAPESETD